MRLVVSKIFNACDAISDPVKGNPLQGLQSIQREEG
jgi:hypothetical protein